MADFDIVPDHPAPPGGAPPPGSPPPPPPVPPMGGSAVPPPPAVTPPTPPVSAPPPAASTTDNSDYASIFEQKPNRGLRIVAAILGGIVVLLLVLALINRFVYDLGLGSILPFLAKPSSQSTPVTTEAPSETSSTITPTETTSSGTSVTTSEVKQRDSKRKADLALIQSALVVYQKQKGAYPSTIGRVKLNTAGNPLEIALVPTFLASLPKDPQDPQFTYQYQSDGKTYTLSTIIEDSTDPQAKSGGSFYFFEVTP